MAITLVCRCFRETWGKRYVGAKVKQRNLPDKDYCRIVASVDNTNVTIKEHDDAAGGAAA